MCHWQEEPEEINPKNRVEFAGVRPEIEWKAVPIIGSRPPGNRIFVEEGSQLSGKRIYYKQLRYYGFSEEWKGSCSIFRKGVSVQTS